jgi:hypothetical protein
MWDGATQTAAWMNPLRRVVCHYEGVSPLKASAYHMPIRHCKEALPYGHVLMIEIAVTALQYWPGVSPINDRIIVS